MGCFPLPLAEEGMVRGCECASALTRISKDLLRESKESGLSRRKQERRKRHKL